MKTFFAILSAAILLFSFAAISSAELPVSDVKEINQYKMTDQKLAQFFQATKNLVPVVQKASPRDDDAEDDDEDVETLTNLTKQFDGIPGATKAVTDAGMTSREYLTFQFALVYAASGQLILRTGAKLPAEYSKENVDFFVKHEAEFKTHQEDFEKVRNFTKDVEATEDDEEDEDD